MAGRRLLLGFQAFAISQVIRTWVGPSLLDSGVQRHPTFHAYGLLSCAREELGVHGRIWESSTVYS